MPSLELGLDNWLTACPHLGKMPRMKTKVRVLDVQNSHCMHAQKGMEQPIEKLSRQLLSFHQLVFCTGMETPHRIKTPDKCASVQGRINKLWRTRQSRQGKKEPRTVSPPDKTTWKNEIYPSHQKHCRTHVEDHGSVRTDRTRLQHDGSEQTHWMEAHMGLAAPRMRLGQRWRLHGHETRIGQKRGRTCTST